MLRLSDKGTGVDVVDHRDDSGRTIGTARVPAS
jgi:hypothetical protein